jgi:hypothetical protein
MPDNRNEYLKGSCDSTFLFPGLCHADHIKFEAVLTEVPLN